MVTIYVLSLEPIADANEIPGFDEGEWHNRVRDSSILVDCSTDFGCCETACVTPIVKQQCFVGVYAGGDMSVLVDDCNRMYVFGSLHKVRNNACLLKKNCLEALLNKADASINFPADQLNCKVRPQNGNCNCRKCCDKSFKTDLDTFRVNLAFPHQDDDCGCDGPRRPTFAISSRNSRNATNHPNAITPANHAITTFT